VENSAGLFFHLAIIPEIEVGRKLLFKNGSTIVLECAFQQALCTRGRARFWTFVVTGYHII